MPNQPDEAKSWGHQGKRPGGLGPGKEGQNHAGLPELDVSLLLSGPCPLLPSITEGAGVLTRTHPGGREGCGLPDGLLPRTHRPAPWSATSGVSLATSAAC